MTTYEIFLKDSDVEFLDDVSNDIRIARKLIPFDDVTSEDSLVIVQYEEDPETIQHKYEIIDVNDETVTMKWVNKLEESMLTEAPVIQLNDDEMNNPEEINFKKIIKNAEDKEAAEQSAAAEAEKHEALKDKYSNVYTDLKTSMEVDSPLDTLQMLFDALVPDQGAADTVAGELVRAIMRILYRDANAGDKFFQGYGLETCGSSAEYLFDNGFDSQIKSILDDVYRLADDDTAYTHAIESLASDIITTIVNDESLIYTPNTEDSREYSYDYIQENQPRYEFELYGSDDVVTLVEKGVLDSWALNRYVEEQLEYESACEGFEVDRPWGHHDTSVTVSNLTRDGYDYLHDMFNRNVEGFWEQLVDEYADELADSEEESEEDYDDDDSYDEE